MLSRNSKNRSNRSTPHPRIFTYTDIISATMNFKVSFPGEESVGGVHKGWIDEMTYAPSEDGVGMAVAVMKGCSVQLDLSLLGEHSHPNLVNSLGYCLEDDYLFCVCEFMQNGSLDKHLSRELVGEPISWLKRLEIATGAARGLVFLHTRNEVTFNQFKTSLILLDGDYNAKLDTIQEKLVVTDYEYSFKTDSYYAAPEWYAFQVAKLDGGLRNLPDGFHSVKSEVYSFGVVLLEILTGQKVYDVTRTGGKQNLVKWAMSLLPDTKNLEMLVDPYLNNRYPLEGAYGLSTLIHQCLQSNEEKRPSMEEVLERLEEITVTKMETN